jgi:hypothetical protein
MTIRQTVTKIVAKITRKQWPPLEEDFAKGLWGTLIWDTAKPTIEAGAEAATARLTSYVQSVINRYGIPTIQLKVDGRFGPKTKVAVAELQSRYGLPVNGIIDRQTWSLIDWIAFESYWRPRGRNKYKNWIVDDHGLSRETSFVECYVRVRFSYIKLSRNWMVDRLQRLSDRVRSEHAYGNALDFTRITRAQGDQIAAFVRDNADIWNVAQIVWHGGIDEPLGGRSNAATAVTWVWRKLKPTSLQHNDHVHVTLMSGSLPAVLKAVAG